ncbi:MAG: hypothetical protein WC052_06035 [Patescibacteria group bacterium]
MNVLNWDELEAEKAYLMHKPNDGETLTCRAYNVSGYKELFVQVEGYRDEHKAAHFRDNVFMEIEMPSRSDWALAILRKDSA